jgi:putative endonuclease
MSEHLETGKEGEEAALKFLMNLGYRILDVNWRFGHLEIDVVARDGREIVVIEVKTRVRMPDNPLELVSRTKQKLLVRAANAYVQYHGIRDAVRFDIVLVLKKNGEFQFEQIKDAYYPTLK